MLLWFKTCPQYQGPRPHRAACGPPNSRRSIAQDSGKSNEGEGGGLSPCRARGYKKFGEDFLGPAAPSNAERGTNGHDKPAFGGGRPPRRPEQCHTAMIAGARPGLQLAAASGSRRGYEWVSERQAIQQQKQPRRAPGKRQQPTTPRAHLPHAGPVKQGRGKVALDTRAVMGVPGTPIFHLTFGKSCAIITGKRGDVPRRKYCCGAGLRRRRLARFVSVSASVCARAGLRQRSGTGPF